MRVDEAAVGVRRHCGVNRTAVVRLALAPSREPVRAAGAARRGAVARKAAPLWSWSRAVRGQAARTSAAFRQRSRPRRGAQ